jgi:hypothetical protein
MLTKLVLLTIVGFTCALGTFSRYDREREETEFLPRARVPHDKKVIPERLKTTHNKRLGGENFISKMDPLSKKRSDQYELKLDQNRLRELINDFEEFGIEYWDETADEREVVIEALTKAFANTAAKLILNFGKVVGPVAEEWATIMQYVQVDPMCD